MISQVNWTIIFCKVKTVSLQHSGEEDEEEVPEKLGKLQFRKSDVLGEALNAVIANDSDARRSLMERFAKTYLMFPVPLRKAIWEGRGKGEVWTQ